MPSVAPADAASKPERIADRLREQIISSALPRGERCGRRRIAQRFDSTVTVTDQALRQLETEGYVRRVGRSYVVAPLCLGASPLMQRRLVLERGLARRAATLITPFGLRRLERLHVELLDAQARQDILDIQACNYRFHMLIYGFGERDEWLTEIRSVWAVFPFDLMTTMPQRMQAVAREHERVLHALATRDEDGAERAMQAHIDQGWHEFQRNYQLALPRRRTIA